MNLKRRLVLLTTALAFLSTTGYMIQAYAAKKGISKGQKFPKIDLAYLGKKSKFKHEKLNGKVVIVDFWASWCTPCKVELPFLNGLYKKHKKKGLVVVGVNVDEEAKSAKSFLKEHPVNFPIVYDKTRKLINKANVQTMPTSYILDRKGKVRYIHKGFHEESMDKFKKQVAKLLKEK